MTEQAQDPKGSRYFFKVYEGLFSGKHLRTMGQALWLYGWMLGRAWAAQRDGTLTYCHLDAARELETSERSVKRWFSQLEEHRYIEITAKHRYDMDVAITNWRPIDEWLASRSAGGGVAFGPRDARNGTPHGSSRDAKNGTGATFGTPQHGRDATFGTPGLDDDGPRDAISGTDATRSDTRSDTRSAKSGTDTITIRLQDYSYPSGSAGAEPSLNSLADLFHDLKAKLVIGTNRPAMLRLIYKLCFGGPEETLPDYGYLGKVARAVGGEGRLAELMWQLTVREPKSDPLAYLQQMAKQGGVGKRNGQANEDGLSPQQEILKRRMEAIKQREAGDGSQ